MSKAVGWLVIILIVVLLGTHPSALAGLLRDSLGILQRAGDELSAFLSKL